MATSSKHSPQKKKMMQLVHIGKNQLKLDDSTYREMLWHVTGKTSSKDCTAASLRKVIDHMETLGFKVTPAKKHQSKKPDAAKSKQALMDKIEALLTDGAKPWEYASSMAKHMYKVDALTFCDGRQLRGIVTALTKHNQKMAALAAKASADA
ncbi:gp16 family protein [Psychrobacter fulvigenes]|uniref:gp16 family protein n=1 Tax=Psychrobacter fulvigenes TaxID=533323 RepID=UPI0019196F96|nr:regulatory protein GemA [Psychrobacter fulvigenes]